MSQFEPIQQVPQIIRIKQLVMIVGLSRSTIYEMINPDSPRYESTFPKPVKLGARAVGWILEDINLWLLYKSKSQAS
ncbi:helix-turn-helix transcriptional regulator [Vibrio breoganii]